ncbi:efflux RND transporter periplasmic adaptor subunit [Paraburkholderia haematera]|uniref:Efflux pump periplasmic linker BepD n=1 Tax=Paraburkholderia haematera TaxID=2793077 RepID=A0ABN7MT84_9BURK|nr:efflux RND transporter periplasmic adaptor subunit [Paraburkholderia haematera]CAE6818060.1 Efflux pump periplasmic linker BepD [Paraburkholderia haematera]
MSRNHLGLAIAGLTALALCAACSKPATLPVAGAIEVTVMPVVQSDTPVDFEFTAQTQSSREVEIRARVDGFLDKRLYTEGQMVRAGQTLFQMDSKPFDAALQTAKGQLAQQQARLTVAKANLARVIPLAKQNALSQKDLDDATGNEKQAEAAVFAALGQVQTAQLNLSYTTIKSPLTGLSSFARQQDGSFVTASASGLLTYVYQLDPMWVNFSISENELLKYREDVKAGRLRFPANDDFEVTLIMADGTEYPDHGRISFTNPAFSTETGTFLVRATFANEKGQLRPGQFVRARVSGASRPKAILVPQRSVLQGAKSHFVWVVDNDSKAHQRVVEVGEWHGDDWFITQGLQPGERVVVDGAIRVAADVPLKIVAAPAAHAAATVPGGGESSSTARPSDTTAAQ